jgi:hypothetical protein
LNRSEFTKDERKEALQLYIDTPNNWKKIAARFGDGRSRSPEMMENLLKTLTRKLTRFGLSLEHREDVHFIPDEFFSRGFPRTAERLQLVRAFDRAKEMLRGMPLAPPSVPYAPPCSDLVAHRSG